MRALVIVAIVMVAVIMGVSAVAPAMANHGGPDLPQKVCDQLTDLFNDGKLPPALVNIWADHCFPPRAP